MHSRNAIFAAVLILLAAPAAAQRVHGDVFDDATGRPINGATVTLLHWQVDSVMATAEAKDGRFSVFAPAPGYYRVRVRGFGYQSFSTKELELGLDQVLTMVIRLHPDAIALAPIAVVGERSEPAYMRDVHERRRAGFGRFILREDIEQFAGSHLADALRMQAGVQVQVINDPRRGRGVPVIFTRAARFLADACPANLYINGSPFFLAKASAALNDPDMRNMLIEFSEIPMADLEAVEIYRGAAELPAMFSGSNSECGVVAIWLRGST